MTYPSILRVLEYKKLSLEKDARILDFGCGSGQKVKSLQDLGYDAYGVDIRFKDGPNVQSLIDQGRLQEIHAADGKIPFPDGYFDIVFSIQVLEHVPDHNIVAQEISRVLNNHGVSIHHFPSRLRPIESHRLVPFCSIIRSRAWMAFWVFLGFRKKKHRDYTIRDLVSDNLNYLNNSTNYIHGRVMQRVFRKYFSQVEFAELCWLKTSPNKRGRILGYLSDFIPFIPLMYSVFWAKVLFLRK